MWGYPVATVVFAAASLTMVANAIWRSPGIFLAGLAIIVVGVQIYFSVRRQSAVQNP